MNILLFGENGQLGARLKQLLTGRGTVRSVGHDQLDLRDTGTLRRVLRESRPELILNAAAYTAVDAAEQDAESARLVNASAPEAMAEAASESGALLIHYSTDYVFDGQANAPYTEDAPVHPLGQYGASKLEGERAVKSTGAASVILRTAWLYSNRGRNFLNTILRLSDERPELRVVSDQTGSPTFADSLAEATVELLDGMFSHGEIRRERCGLYHATCSGETTWFEFARSIIELAGKSNRVSVIPIPSADYPTPVKRPAYSVLSSEKLYRTFGIRMPEWRAALERCMTERLGG